MSGRWRTTKAALVSSSCLVAGLGCTGSEWFTYEHEAPAKVDIDVRVDHPPVITLVVVAPLQTDVGQWISLMATADDADGDEVHFLWTANGGKIDAPKSRETKLTCTRNGLFLLTLTVSDTPGMKQTMNVPFTCI
jgi:hypothetical protein